MEHNPNFDRWLEILEAESFEDLTFAEVRKALQALSSVYVQKRDKLSQGGALNSRGKRTAFALFYGPLHGLFVSRVLEKLGPETKVIRTVLDLGCGTGVGGVAWSNHATDACAIRGYDLNGWALGEAQRTFKTFKLEGKTFRQSMLKLEGGGPKTGIIAAYSINELSDGQRDEMLRKLKAQASRGTKILILEPIAKTPNPWWEEWVAAFEEFGGESKDWKFPVRLPPILEKLDRAAKMNHRVLKGRTLWVAPSL